MIICYTVPEIWCMIDVIIFHFRPFFALLQLKTKTKTAQKKQNFEKMENMLGDIIIIHMCTSNYDQMMYGILGHFLDWTFPQLTLP